MSVLHTEETRKTNIQQDRGSELPARTCRWLKVNDVLTQIEEYPKTVPFEGVTTEGLTDAQRTEGKVQEQSGVDFGNVGHDAQGISEAVAAKNAQEANVSYSWAVEDGAVQTLHFALSKENLVLQDRLQLRVPCGHCATVVLDVKSDENTEVARNGMLDIAVEEDADLQLVLINRLNSNAISNQRVAFTVADGGNLRVAHVELGGARTNYHLSGDLLGVEAKMEEYVAYLAQEQEKIDLFYHVRFHGLYTEGVIRADGALLDQAYKSFRGTLDFLEGARGAVGDEEEVTVLMSDEAHSVAVPVLLCHEDAVEGNHATSAGRVDEEMLFYLMSRGLSRSEAEGMIVESRMAETLDRLPDPVLKENIRQAIHERLIMRKR